MKYINCLNDDIYFNLALEEYVFNKFKDDSYLLFWKNDRSLVLGKYQNVFEEINLKTAEDLDIKVARRNSGGGTVFHDKGNLNYSFIKDYNPNSFVDYDVFLNPVISALESLGINAAKKRTSDIAIDGKKISGSAQAIAGGRILHHGTLLFDTDLSMLHDLLKTAEGEFTSNAVKSTRSQVTNIKEHIGNQAMTIDEFQTLLLKTMFPEGIQEVKFSGQDWAAITNLAQSKYSTWEWNYGNSPRFSYVKESNIGGAPVSLRLQVENGIIVQCEVLKGKLPVNNIEDAVRGLRYSYTVITNRLNELIPESNAEEFNVAKLAQCFF